jgi:hypothetical protein
MLMISKHADDIESGIAIAAASGGDTDTVASIVGAMLGAVHGRHALPQRWIDGLTFRERSKTPLTLCIATSFAASASGIACRRPAYTSGQDRSPAFMVTRICGDGRPSDFRAAFRTMRSWRRRFSNGQQLEPDPSNAPA